MDAAVACVKDISPIQNTFGPELLYKISSSLNYDVNDSFRHKENFLSFCAHDKTYTVDLNRLNSEVILDEIEALPYDWNGCGVAPFSRNLIDKCRKVIDVLHVQPDIFPTGRQSIQFQYDLPDRTYLCFEVYEDKTVCLVIPKRIYKEAEETEIISSEVEQIREKVDHFYGSYSTKK